MRVVALGGGHGLAATLKAARQYADDITAIVSVADDGGSSGRLRQAFGIPAPGDLRRCLVALSDPDSTWAQAFEHRFDAGELEGHALGNLVIAGLAEATGDFIAALDEVGRLLGAHGRVLPATTEPVVLKAEAAGGPVEGQVAVQNAGRIAAVSLVPADAAPPPAALEAIAAADQVVLGPGSLFTSILAVVAVPAIRDAVAATTARRIYVCNLREQRPETDGYDVAAHVDALAAHGVLVDDVLAHPGALPRPTHPLDARYLERDVALPDLSGHDPARLGRVLADLVG
jgi:uncharacterized cofD-like protein